MGSVGSTMRPQELIEFRKLNTSIDNVEIPARSENRTATDKKGFVIFGIGILFLLPFLIYCLTKSDLRHFYHPTDDCGNFCGLNNTRNEVAEAECSGKNFVDKPYWNTKSCLASCGPDEVVYEQTCIFDNPYSLYHTRMGMIIKITFKEADADSWKFFVTIFVTTVLSVLILVALKCAPAAVVWVTLILAVVILFAVTGLLWFLYSLIPDNYRERGLMTSLISAGSIWTSFVLIVFIMILILIKKIRLVLQLYREALKVLADMPLLIIVSILVIFVQLALLGIFYATSFYLAFSLDLYKIGTSYRYSYSPLTIFTIVLNTVVTIWAMYFVGGIQYMIVSGSVARWFFARNKQYLDSPILTSTKVAMKYHLGTVAFGSFFIMLLSIPRIIIKVFFRNVCCRCLFIRYCSSVEIVLKFISENSYIQTAIHGQSYCKSEKRSTKLLLTNARSVATINSVGDFLLLIITIVVCLLASVPPFFFFPFIFNPTVSLLFLICLVINITIVSVTFATFQIIVDTLLLCFCEDSLLNDGISRPYYTSKGLMDFLKMQNNE